MGAGLRATTTLLGGWGQSEGREGHEPKQQQVAARRAEMERTLVQRSLEDEDFRQRLLDDPKGTVEQELGSAAA